MRHTRFLISFAAASLFLLLSASGQDMDQVFQDADAPSEVLEGPYLPSVADDSPVGDAMTATVEYTVEYPDGTTEVIRSNTNLFIRLALQSYVQTVQFYIYMNFVNELTTSGGPYTVTNVIMTLQLSAAITILEMSGASLFSCGLGKRSSSTVQCTASTVPANSSEEIGVLVVANEPGTYSATLSSTQDDYDPDTSNNSDSKSITVLPATSISGQAFDDKDGDGTKESGDTGIEGECFILDSNKDGVDDAGEPTATTDSNGDYSILPVDDGTHTVRRCNPTNSEYYANSPESGSQEVVVNGSSVTDVDFSFAKPAQFYVQKWEDNNADGQRAESDAGIFNWQIELQSVSEQNVFVNQTVDGSIALRSTNESGFAYFENVRAGEYFVRELPQTDYTQSYAAFNETVAHTIYSGQTFTSPGFGNWKIPDPAQLYFVIDLNANFVFDDGESLYAGQTAFIDENSSGTLDDGEVSATTTSSGPVALQPNTLGTHPVCVFESDDFTPLDPVASSGVICRPVTFESGSAEQPVYVFVELNGFSITARIWEDLFGNGEEDSNDPAAEGVCTYLSDGSSSTQGDNDPTSISDAAGQIRFGPIANGTHYLRVCDDSDSFAPTFDGGSRQIVIQGQNFDAFDFPVVTPSRVSYSVWHDRNADATRQEGEESLTEWQGSLTGSRPLFAAYNTSVTTSEWQTDSQGQVSFTNLMPGPVTSQVSLLDQWYQSFPLDSAPLTFELLSGGLYEPVGFGVYTAPGPLFVRIFQDDNDSTPIQYIRFWADLDWSGTENEGEPAAVSDANGQAYFQLERPGEYPICTSTTTVSPVSPANDDGGAWCVPVTFISEGSPQSTTFTGNPNPVIIEGYKWVDLDNDGEEDDGEPRLNGLTINLLSGGTVIASAETADLDRDESGTIDATTERGWYQFVVAADGEYVIEEVIPDGMEQTSPQGGSHQVTITGLQSPAIAYPFGNFIAALDWGDLPDPREDLAQDCPRGEPINCYRTLAGVQGAAHMISATGVRLGQRIDAEGDGQPNADATGDDDNISSQGAEDDEDGLISFSIDGTGKISMTLDVSGDGFLDAWADMNDDGVMNDGVLGGSPIESFFVAKPIVNGINILETPEGVVEPYADIKYIRLRVSSTGGLRAAGVALDGEVEDYRVYVQEPQSVNSDADTGDATPGDGICADADGNCSLRAAIEEANASGRPFRIDFAVAGKRAVVLTPTSPFPTFQVPIIVNGGGELEIDGSQAGTDANGLTIAAGGSEVSGVAIHSFSGDGIHIASGEGSTVWQSVIHGNEGNGVTVSAGNRNAIRHSAIYDNGGLGIDLGNDGVTDNDLDDSDSGVNGLINYPELSLVTAENGRIEGSVLVAAGATVNVDLFSSSGCDASGNGEGQAYLTSVTVSSGPGGSTPFSVELIDPLQIGQVITATTTDAYGNTSEFSPCFVAVTTDIERDESAELPQQFTLDQNYPNPFNPVTTIQFSVARTEHVRIEVFDMLGKRVAGLVDRTMEAGSYTVSFDAQDLPSGQYIYTMQAGSFQQTKTLTLLK